MQKIVFPLICSLIIIASCGKEEIPGVQTPLPVLRNNTMIAAVPSGPLPARDSLNEHIRRLRDQNGSFDWTWIGLRELCAAVYYSDRTWVLGYKPLGVDMSTVRLNEIGIGSGKWREVHDALIGMINDYLRQSKQDTLELSDILIEDDPVLPVLTLRTDDRNLITLLYNLENVRYLEPLGYWPYVDERSASGCSGSSYPLQPADYSVLSTGSLLPWNYPLIGLPAAWSQAAGQGISIGIIDAGISASQGLLGSSFATGMSTGRSLSTDFTLGSSAYTTCVHGTSMCGLAAAPRSSSPSVCGIAYQSSLRFIRACNDVVLDASAEKTGVKNALIRLGQDPAIDIISMSIGTPLGSSLLRDGVDYAYAAGKLIFAAAGTSFGITSWWGVIYPAAYASCVAVTGVDESGYTCSNCHDGSAVMFTIPMERNSNNDRNTLALAPTGNPPTYVGGSSSATASTAGIAALVWSARPNMTREQLILCLRNTAQYYPVKSSSRGYGNIHANFALSYALQNY